MLGGTCRYENITTIGLDRAVYKRYCDNIPIDTRRVVTVRTSTDGKDWSDDHGCADAKQKSEHCKTFNKSAIVAGDADTGGDDPPDLEFYRIRPFTLGESVRKKRISFAPFYTNKDRFTKTDSGQTWGKHSKKRDAFFAGSRCRPRSRLRALTCKRCVLGGLRPAATVVLLQGLLPRAAHVRRSAVTCTRSQLLPLCYRATPHYSTAQHSTAQHSWLDLSKSLTIRRLRGCVALRMAVWGLWGL